MLIALLEHPDREKRDLSSIRTIMSGASAVPATLIRRTVRTLGCGTTILFGQTEMHGVIGQTRLTDSPEDQEETVGQPLPDLEVKVADPVTGEALPVGEPGEICCRRYQNMIEYYEMPDATRETIDSDNWLHMGDLGCAHRQDSEVRPPGPALRGRTPHRVGPGSAHQARFRIRSGRAAPMSRA